MLLTSKCQCEKPNIFVELTPTQANITTLYK